MKKIIIFILLIFPLICIAEVRYKIVNLETRTNIKTGANWPGGINNKGEIVGTLVTPEGEYRIFKYSDIEGMVDLGNLECKWIYGNDINDNGQIIAAGIPNGTNSYSSFLFTPGSGFSTIKIPIDNSDTTGYKINNSGQIAIGFEIQPYEIERAFRYTPSIGFEDLYCLNGEETYSYAINNKGWVTGGSKGGSTFLYQDGYSGLIKVCPGKGTGINDNGTILGEYDLLTPFIYRNGERQFHQRENSGLRLELVQWKIFSDSCSLYARNAPG